MQSLLDFCASSGVYEKPEEVKLPRPGGPPVQLIAPPVPGIVCTMSSECNYCVLDQPTMLRHLREKHAVTPLTVTRYHSGHVQQLFTAVGKSYFEVNPDLALKTVPNVRDSLEAMLSTMSQSPLVASPDTDRGRTPLMQFMGWDTFMPDIRKDPNQRRLLHNLKQKHTPGEYEGIFPRLVEAVQDHFKEAHTILDGHPHRLTILKVVVHGMPIPRESYVLVLLLLYILTHLRQGIRTGSHYLETATIILTLWSSS